MDVTKMTTEDLVEFCMNDDVTWDELEPALDELTRRRREMPGRKTVEEAWAEFVKHYMPREFIDPNTGTVLTPSWHGEKCQGNSECCDECDYYLDCFPDWETTQDR